MNEVVEKKTYDVLKKDDIEFLIKFDEMKKRAKSIEDRIKSSAHEFLEENGLLEEGFRQDGIYIYETKPYKKKQVDMNKLKEEGVYDLYTHDVWVKGSIRIQVEYDD